jgi:hypothetical protein
MTAGSEPNGSQAPLPVARERAFGGRRDPGEPRFAGPPTAGVRPAPPLPPWSTEPAAPPEPGAATAERIAAPTAITSPAVPAVPSGPSWSTPPPPVHPPTSPPPSYPPSASDLEPVVDFGPGMHFEPEPRDGLLLSRIGCGVAVAGGLMAALGSLFTWATLRLTAAGSDASGFTTDPSSIKYNGLSLLEGRAILVLGIVAIALAGFALPLRAPRLLPFGLAVTGGLAVVVMAFAAIGHPVELATLFRSYRQIDAVKVSLPNGAGTWCSLIGALLVLAGGLLALMRGNTEQPVQPVQPVQPMQQEGRA